MSDHFKAGDVVACVDDTPCRCGRCPGVRFPTRRGGIYRVEAVDPPRFRGDIWGLVLVGVVANGVHNRAINIARFRHLPKADEQFTARIRACKPIREGVPA